MEGLETVRHAVEDDLLARHDLLAAQVRLPNPDRIVILEVAAIDEQAAADVLRVRLKPIMAGECFCEFTPGQYLEYRRQSRRTCRAPTRSRMRRKVTAYVELHIRRVEGGRFADMGVLRLEGRRSRSGHAAHSVSSRCAPGPIHRCCSSPVGRALRRFSLCCASRFALEPQRDMVFVWVWSGALDFYAKDELLFVQDQAPHLRIVFAAEESTLALPRTLDQAVVLCRGRATETYSSEAGTAGRPRHVCGWTSAHVATTRPSVRPFWHPRHKRVHTDFFI